MGQTGILVSVRLDDLRIPLDLDTANHLNRRNDPNDPSDRRWHVLWFSSAAMPRTRLMLPILLILFAVSAAACREEGDIKIASLNFDGVEQVDKGALANALQTKKGSRFLWGRKRYFDRRAFEADLKRIEAFYRDRGFPDARVASFDAKLNDTQNEVDVTVIISEGEPIRVAAIELRGLRGAAGACAKTAAT